MLIVRKEQIGGITFNSGSELEEVSTGENKEVEMEDMSISLSVELLLS